MYVSPPFSMSMAPRSVPLTAPTIARMFFCFTMTPFGSPVEPDVYMITATLSGLGGWGATGLARPSSSTSAYESSFTPRGGAALTFDWRSSTVFSTSV